jgi:hypothetical protein
MSLAPGSAVVVHLGQPREQVFGVLLSMNMAGLVLRGIAIGSVDDWIRQATSDAADSGEEGPHAHLGLTQTFFPMHRVERISLDETSHGLPSIGERFQERVGRDLAQWVLETHGDVLLEG